MGSDQRRRGEPRGLSTVDEDVRAALDRGDVPRALAATISAYGAEVYGFLRAVTRGQDARLAYGRLIERLHHDLVELAWDTEVRVMVYTAAREEARRDREHVRDAVVGEARMSPEDLELLVLRLDRQLTWPQIARTSLGSSASEDLLLGEAARLRRRFSEVARELTLQSKDRDRGKL